MNHALLPLDVSVKFTFVLFSLSNVNFGSLIHSAEEFAKFSETVAFDK